MSPLHSSSVYFFTHTHTHNACVCTHRHTAPHRMHVAIRGQLARVGSFFPPQWQQGAYPPSHPTGLKEPLKRCCILRGSLCWLLLQSTSCFPKSALLGSSQSFQVRVQSAQDPYLTALSISLSTQCPVWSRNSEKKPVLPSNTVQGLCQRKPPSSDSGLPYRIGPGLFLPLSPQTSWDWVQARADLEKC